VYAQYCLSGNMTDEAGKKCRMVFITARVHPGESPASLVCQGVLEGSICANKTLYKWDALIMNPAASIIINTD